MLICHPYYDQYLASLRSGAVWLTQDIDQLRVHGEWDIRSGAIPYHCQIPLSKFCVCTDILQLLRIWLLWHSGASMVKKHPMSSRKSCNRKYTPIARGFIVCSYLCLVSPSATPKDWYRMCNSCLQFHGVMS